MNEKIPLDIKLMGIFVLIVLGGMSVMTVMSLAAPLPSTVEATRASGKYIVTTLYSASDYGAPANYDGDPFVYDFRTFEGKQLDLTLTPKVLALASVYLMKISEDYFYLQNDLPGGLSSGWASHMEDVENDVIKIAEFDLPANEISLGLVDIPVSDRSRSSWWIVCFCENMGYRGGPDNNPDGRVVIDITIEG